MTERELQNLVVEWCRWHRVLSYHTHDSRRSEPGFPDLVIVGPSGCLIRELKSQRGRVRPEQAIWLAALGAAGLNAAVWRPSDWPSTILEQLGTIR